MNIILNQSKKHFRDCICLVVVLMFFSQLSMASKKFLHSDVTFSTSDEQLQKLFDLAQTKAISNIVQFTPTMKILVEGGGYSNAWIETQPMGGQMYAKRNIEVALNNQLVFILSQRSDGRIPGMVINTDKGLQMLNSDNVPDWMIWMPKSKLMADFEMFQGYCFPDPAWRMYFWIGKDKDYLCKVYKALEAHDAYLWRTRDSNNDGILETWCVWDTGEDGSTRLYTRNAPYHWPFDFPPGPNLQGIDTSRFWSKGMDPNQVLVPFASMDVMSYSYDGRNALAKIAQQLDNGKADYWKQQAEKVRQRLIKALWDPSRHACFDRDRNNNTLNELIHNNLRVMYHGVFTQSMADSFIKHHLLNPQEFWTPVPLTSIAVNEPLFRNIPGNNWSGQPQGLTYQRAIRALENYGHFAEVSLIGSKLIPVLIQNDCRFTQQLDPYTGKQDGPRRKDGYGPMLLATLEYISRMYGTHLDLVNGQAWWSSLCQKDFTYTQKLHDQSWQINSKKDRFTAFIDGKKIFSCTAGVRVITDLNGNISQIVGISPHSMSIVLQVGDVSHELTVKPNQVYSLSGGKITLQNSVPFDYPYPGAKKP